PWVRVASSVQSWMEDSLESRSALGTGCARSEAIITRRNEANSGRLIPINTHSPKPARWKRCVPRDVVVNVKLNEDKTPQPRGDTERERREREGESGRGGDEGTRGDKVISLLISLSPPPPRSRAPAFPLSVQLTP